MSVVFWGIRLGLAIFVLYLRWLMRVSLRRGLLCKLEMNGESAQIIGGILVSAYLMSKLLALVLVRVL